MAIACTVEDGSHLPLSGSFPRAGAAVLPAHGELSELSASQGLCLPLPHPTGSSQRAGTGCFLREAASQHSGCTKQPVRHLGSPSCPAKPSEHRRSWVAFLQSQLQAGGSEREVGLALGIEEAVNNPIHESVVLLQSSLISRTGPAQSLQVCPQGWGTVDGLELSS